MRIKRNLLAMSAVFFASATCAGTMGPVVAPKSWVATISLGPVWENAGRTQTFFLAPELEKTYSARKTNKTLIDGELFLGAIRPLSAKIQAQFGLAVAATSSAKLQGHIWDDADPEFDNYIYSYKVQHTHIAVKGKLIAPDYWFMPWVSASLGIGFNDAHSYTNTPTIIEAIQNPNFASHTQTTYSYTLGAGVQKTINDHWQVGVGYEFADWGKSNLGPAITQTIGTGLRLKHLYTNGALFNLTYIA